MALPVYIVVGGGGPYDPAVGDDTLTLPFIVGKEFYIMKTGYGFWPTTFYGVDIDDPQKLVFDNAFLLNESFSIHLSGTLLPTEDGSNDYTNGFNYSQVYTALKNRIGWLANYAPKPVVDGPNQVSQSGRYYQDFHTTVTPLNVWSTMEEANANDAAFNAHLSNLTRASVMRILNKVFRVPELLKCGMVYERLGQNDTVVESTGQFIGYEIDSAPVTNASGRMDSLVLSYTEDVTFPMYLFKDGKKSPLMSIPVTAVANEATVVNINVLLSYLNTTTKGGKFFFGYFQDDLGTAKAIREQVCEETKFPYLSIQSVSIPKIPGETDIDRNQRSYTRELNGFNIQLSVFRDHTRSIVQYGSFFDEAVGLSVACAVIEQMLFTIRSNGTERELKDSITSALQMDLQGALPISDGPQIKSLRSRLDAEIIRLRQTFFPRGKNINVNLQHAH